jgi:hypothetical protein
MKDKCERCLIRNSINEFHEINECEDKHTCPYQSEINDDNDSLCNCCSDCQYECAMDI